MAPYLNTGDPAVKIFISADMEGVAGVVHWDQVDPGKPDYDHARRLMTAEVNAVVAGAIEGGAGDVVVNDSHYTMRNLLPQELDRRARLISGSFKPLSMIEGLQDGGFAAALFIGYHAGAAHPGVLGHTYSSGVIQAVRLNGRPAGEVTINAAAAGALGVPVAMVAGDVSAVSEARDLLGEGQVEGVAVKEARGRYSALSPHPEVARERISSAATRAVRMAPVLRPWTPPPPHTFEVVFHDTGMAESALLLPGAERVDGITLRYTATDYLTAYKAMRAMITLAAATTR